MERKSISGLLLLLIVLFAAQEMVVKTEGRTCEKPSKYFSGPCIGSSGQKQCGYLCVRGEGLLGGYCKGFKCVCTRACTTYESS